MSFDHALKGGSTMTTSITGRTELAHRTSDGIDVYLFWNEPTNHVTVRLVDVRTNESFEFEIDGPDALDAFNHPYAHAGPGGPTAGAVLRHRPAASTDEGSNSQEPTITQRRSDHAPTDR
jgi:hypothetical protein